MINKESSEEWRGQSLLDTAAWDRAAACLSELPPLVLFMVFHQASLGDSQRFPGRLLTPNVGAVLANNCRSFFLEGGTLFTSRTMSSDALDGPRGGLGGWNIYLLCTRCLWTISHLIFTIFPEVGILPSV